jgi:hypothetical protein
MPDIAPQPKTVSDQILLQINNFRWKWLQLKFVQCGMSPWVVPPFCRVLGLSWLAKVD